MQYDSYQNKIKRISAFLSKLYAHILLITVATVAVALLITLGVVTKGLIVSDNGCPDEIMYGERASGYAWGILCRVRYEYRPLGETEWGEEHPTTLGSYEIRATTTTAFGQRRYGEVYAFTVVPREITVAIDPRQKLIYGDTPTLEKLDLAYEDTITAPIHYANPASLNTRVWINENEIVIANADGRSVTGNYRITVGPAVNLTRQRRPITVTVQNAEKAYDGQQLVFSGYELSDGNLAEGDRLLAVFNESITEVGETRNIPLMSVYNGDGRDVSTCYDMEIVAGTLTVTTRPLTIYVGSATLPYNGQAQTYSDYSIDPTSPLPAGHRILINNATSLTDCGTVENVLDVSVWNSYEEVSKNYSIFVYPGTLTVTPREVTVYTGSETYAYDGKPHNYEVVSVPELSGRDQCRVLNGPSLTEVGEIENRLTVGFYRMEGGEQVDTSANYRISYQYGTLRVTPRPLMVTVNATKTYDGLPAGTLPGSVLDGLLGAVAGTNASSLPAGFSVKVEVTSNTVDAGSYPLTIDPKQVRVFNTAGEDKTASFAITCVEGLLTIHQRPILLTPNSAAYAYDGLWHRAEGYTVGGERLVKGHTLVSKAFVEQREAGDYPYTCDDTLTTIKDADGRNVRHNYTIQYGEGLLSIRKQTLVLTSGSGSWVYDGLAHGNGEYTVEGLLPGHAAYALVNGSAVDKGEHPNRFDSDETRITDGDRDVTANYDITYRTGTLTITPRPITIASAHATMVYSGGNFIGKEAAVTEGSLIEGHVLSPLLTVSKPNAGQHEIRYDPVMTRIYEVLPGGQNIDRTANYQITYVAGILTVTPRPLPLIPENTTHVYDGTKPALRVTEAEVEDGESAGLLPGHTLQGGQCDYRSVGIYAVTEKDISVKIQSGNTDMTANYTIVFTVPEATLTITPRSLTVRILDIQQVYDGTVPACSYKIEASTKDEGLVTGHTLRMPVYLISSDVGVYACDPAASSITVWENGAAVTDNYAITVIAGTVTILPRPLTLYADSFTVEYGESTYPTATYHYDKAQLVEGDELTAVRLVMPQECRVGTYPITFDPKGTVILNAAGWDVTGNYDMTYVDGTLTVKGRTIILISRGLKCFYDGEWHANPYYDTQNPLPAGCTLTARVIGGGTDAGIYPNEFDREATRVMQDGVDVTDSFEFIYRVTNIEIAPREITLTSENGIWPYDDLSHTSPSYKMSGTLVRGHTLTTAVTTAIRHVGKLENGFDEANTRITDGERDVTHNYAITFRMGTLEITPLVISGKIATVKVPYNGSWQENNSLDRVSGLLEGHVLRLSTTGRLRDVGYVTCQFNEYATIILNAAGEDVTGNYIFMIDAGSLTVEKRVVTLAVQDEKIYDSEGFSKVKLIATDGSLVAEHTAVASVTGTISNVGSMEFLCLANRVTVYEKSGMDVTANYEIHTAAGTLTIHPRPLTLRAVNATWVYDGTTHTASDYVIEEGSLVGKHTLTVKIVGSGRNVGRYENSFQTKTTAIMWGDINVSANYIITHQSGTLEITPRPITITTATGTWGYDGLDHSNQDYLITNGTLADGQTLSLTVNASIRNVGTVENTVRADSVRVMTTTGAVTSNYAITFDYGTLTVTPRRLAVTLADGTWMYDGLAHTTHDYTVTEGTLVAGHTLTLGTRTSVIHVGEYVGAYDPATTAILQGSENVTANYELVCLPGTLTITPRPISVKTADAEKVYDGGFFSNHDVLVTEDGEPLPDGHSISLRVTGVAFMPGLYENTFRQSSFRVYNAEGQDVTADFDPTITAGTLTVRYNTTVIVYTDSAAKNYDGTPLTAPGYSVETSGTILPDAYRLSVTVTGTQTVVGVSENTATVTLLDRQGQDVTALVTVELRPGALTVLAADAPLPPSDDTRIPIKVELTSPAQKVYDGTSLTYDPDAYRATLPDGVSLTLTLELSLTDAGQITLFMLNHLTDTYADYRIMKGGVDVTDAYVLSFTLPAGMEALPVLAVLPRPLAVSGASDMWVYDGERHTAPACTVTDGLLIDGHVLSLQAVGEAQYVGEYRNDPDLATLRITDGARDVTANYEVTPVSGTLTIIPRPITVQAGAGLWTYDDAYHTANTYEITNGSLVDGHTLLATITTRVRDVGIYDNIISDVVIRGDGVDLTENYQITCSAGRLQILPLTIKLSSADEKTVYNGNPVTAPIYDYDLLHVTQPFDIKVLASVITSVTDVGVYPNRFDRTVTQVTLNGRDVTGNFTYVYEEGTIEITPAAATVISVNQKWTYDGQWHTENQTTSRRLANGHTVSAVMTAKIREPGSMVNAFDRQKTRILDADGRDVTHNYTLSFEEGTLMVSTRPITVTTASATKYDDGTPLTAPYAHTTEDSLPLCDGHKIILAVTGICTGVGTEQNTYTANSLRLLDADGNDVTRYYKVNRIELGTLTILAADDGDVNTVGTVTGSLNGTLYLRQNVFGAYNGQGWEAADAYYGTLPGGYGYSYLPALYLSYFGRPVHTVHLSDMKAFLTPYQLAMTGGASIPVLGSDVGSGEIGSGAYDMSLYSRVEPAWVQSFVLSLSESQRKAILGDAYEGELAYRAFVHRMYLSLDETTRTYMDQLIAEQGFDASDPGIITAVARYIQGAATYNLDYDRSLDTQSNVVLAFLGTYREGVCRHYASAATLLYRALGIPARYTVGYRVDVTAGVETLIETPGHAWVEVYIDGFGWLPVEVTGSSGTTPGPVEPPRETLTVTPVQTTKIYDGTPLTPLQKLVEKDLLATLLKQGYTYRVTVEGSQTEIGVGTALVKAFTLYDPYGRDVTTTYNIVLETGYLVVTGETVQIFLYQFQQVYDGTPLVFDREDYEIIYLPQGLKLELDLHITLDRVGSLTTEDINRELARYITYRVLRNGKDVTAEYPLTVVGLPGTEQYPVAVMSARKLELTAASVTRVDNGTSLSNGDVWISKGALVEGHTLTAVTNGTCTAVGSVKNTITDVYIADQNGFDVTDQYDLTTVSGTLTILPAED